MSLDRCNLYLLNPYDVKIGKFLSEHANAMHDWMEEKADKGTTCGKDEWYARAACPAYLIMNTLHPPVSTITITAEATLKGLANIIAIPCTKKEHRWDRCNIAAHTLAWGSLFVPAWGSFESTWCLAFRISSIVIAHPLIPLCGVALSKPYQYDELYCHSEDCARFMRNLQWRKGVEVAPDYVMEHLNHYKSLSEETRKAEKAITSPPPMNPGMNADEYHTL